MEFDEIYTLDTSEKGQPQWRSGSGNWAISFSAVYGGGFCASWYCYTTGTASYSISTTRSTSKFWDDDDNANTATYSFAVGK